MQKPPAALYIDVSPVVLGGVCWRLCESVVAPLVLFYVLFCLTGFTCGLLAALAWVVAMIGLRWMLRTSIPTVLLLTSGLLVVRTLIGFATGSLIFYFLEPSLQHFLIAFLLLVTTPFERTFLARLANDFRVLPGKVLENNRIRRFFRRASVLWALVFIVNGLATLWALINTSLGEFMSASALSFAVVGAAVAGSFLWFRHELHRVGIHVKFTGRL